LSTVAEHGSMVLFKLIINWWKFTKLILRQ